MFYFSAKSVFLSFNHLACSEINLPLSNRNTCSANFSIFILVTCGSTCTNIFNFFYDNYQLIIFYQDGVVNISIILKPKKEVNLSKTVYTSIWSSFKRSNPIFFLRKVNKCVFCEIKIIRLAQNSTDLSDQTQTF